jgi:ankyrin repeat protein
MNLPPPPQDDNPIITQFRPVQGQWELTEDNINRIDPKTGSTILHNYCRHINTTPVEVWRYLIEVKGCDVNAQDNDKTTPVHNALRYFNPNGDITILHYLLSQKGINANIKGYNGCTLLHSACQCINDLPTEIFKVLIETIGADVNVQNNDEDTPLHYAFRAFDPNDGGDITVLMYLLSQGNVNANIKDGHGYTLLHRACININHLPLEIFQYLIETVGCGVNGQDENQDTPLHRAIIYFSPNEDGGNTTVLMYLFGRKDVNVNIKDKYGVTLLHTACDNINTIPLDVFKLVVETHGADVNAQNEYKDTPLHRALLFFNPNKGGDINVLTYLLSQKGLNANTKGYFGETLLHIACQQIKYLPLEIFKCLIETKGCDVNVQNNNKNTPLHNALDSFNPDNGNAFTVLTYLINQKDVNVKIRGNKGRNLLHSVCISSLSAPVGLNARYDTMLCQVVEFIVERYTQQILDKVIS